MKVVRVLIGCMLIGSGGLIVNIDPTWYTLAALACVLVGTVLVLPFLIDETPSSSATRMNEPWTIFRCKDKTGLTNRYVLEIYEGTERVCVVSGFDTAVARERAERIINAIDNQKGIT